MKLKQSILLLVAVVLLNSCSDNEFGVTGIDEYNLEGKPKNIIETYQQPLEWKSSKSYRKDILYRQDGRLDMVKFQNSDSVKFESKYIYGDQLDSVIFDYGENVIDTITFEYLSNGKRLMKKTLRDQVLIECWKNGKKISEFNENSPNRITEFVRDKSQKVIEKIIPLNSEERVEDSNLTFKYVITKTDEFGNWIEKLELQERRSDINPNIKPFEMNISRRIEYY
ncbi:MAG: hypothetical protein AB8F74_06350 [Saprospiraceae bacterium]